MSRKKTQEEFIVQCKEVHGDLYDYSRTKYKSSLSPVEIICKTHGSFSQRASHHLNGRGCTKCATDKNSEELKLSTEDFINRSKEVHGFEYNYDKSTYTGALENIIITCDLHGDFKQLPINHWRGCGCRECSKEKIGNSNRMTKKEFVKKAKEIHGDKYNYENSKYFKSLSKVPIRCNTHGEFNQRPNDHLSGQGCPKCVEGLTTSKGEKEVLRYVEESLSEVKVVPNDKTLLGNSEIDIFIPSKKIAIEYNGLYWHSDLTKEDGYHLQKTERCLEKGVKLIHLFEDEWLDKKEIVESRIENLLGVTENKVYARKCEIREVETSEAMRFLDDNHIQGRLGATVKLGLYYDNLLISLMTFGKLRKNLGQSHKEDHYELLRFCNRLRTSVPGGASKLLKHFEKTFAPEKIISYADRRWSEGGLYYQMGFELIRKSSPNYFYTKGSKRESRFKFRKSELIKQGFNPILSERQIMSSQGYNRIYDCGTLVFHKTYQNIALK